MILWNVAKPIFDAWIIWNIVHIEISDIEHPIIGANHTIHEPRSSTSLGMSEGGREEGEREEEGDDK
ncbi:hypothetical protein COX59_04025 [Candidatus Beckwithbacteria bacterium CG_4_10_14_0_2_um_filter_47_25]|uniref:Uncharacterized protein n=1 Tax=Candidatus Beckwithbacteria bacterium CG_4_10_14_0_2_um_filter_47_25 TaxID=1974493 RepID=A0A2M7W5I2_9BACT|nr:MAG: hypothetical protein COX59_04025 [Candidatus Beckwithbacteria bacterium CG_4_10_14_0_2_um_filter_47_25]